MLSPLHGSIAMKRPITVIVAVLVAVAFVGAGTFAAAAADSPSNESDADAPGAADVEPGERLAGVIGVTDAELEGDLAERTFGVKIAQAASDDAKADVVADQLADVEQRLNELEDREAQIEEARERGELSEGASNAQVATLEAERQTAERLTNASAAVAGELPAELLAEKGIDVEAIDELRDRAAALGGDEVSAIAKSIAGPHVGESMAPDRADLIPADPSADDTPADDDEEGDTDAGNDGDADQHDA